MGTIRLQNRINVSIALIALGLSACLLTACALVGPINEPADTESGLFQFRAGTSPYSRQYLLAAEALAAGRFEEAEQIYLELAGLEPENPHAYVGLGTSRSLQGNQDDAIASFERAIELDPEVGEAHTGLGSAYFRLEDYQAALDHYQATIDIDGTSLDAHYGAAIAAEQLGLTDRARQHCQQILDRTRIRAGHRTRAPCCFGWAAAELNGP